MEKENLKEININVDNMFRLELGGPSSGGYAWEYIIDDPHGIANDFLLEVLLRLHSRE